ncbi:NADPH--sulfite reductase flavoprotein alpha-component [Gordonia effusa NBRC 100432]|uniref:assimilatory sulfite reductase (NADPH) n=1 Tax=Gordonia effusa NBRC 100432 TaxID=1077974 RepID=H0QVQ2_9ACTN|nr:FAD-binding protein [Gordonia effusa]GAB16903.1 NADPH--sulfite reductase flavoprotein alpha-component [Gordonia effusa NBRC 100432]
MTSTHLHNAADSGRRDNGPTSPTTPSRPERRKRSTWGRKNPYRAAIVERVQLSGPDSEKEVHHLVLDLGDSGIEYQPGDGIGVTPVNDPTLVAAILTRLDVDPSTPVTVGRDEVTLLEALSHRVEISTPSTYFADFLAGRLPGSELAEAIATDTLGVWLRGKDVLDLLNIDDQLEISAQELIEELSPLAHRTYSIASSPTEHAGTVHITMSTVRYHAGDRMRGGVCSTYLADRRVVGHPEDAHIGVFVTANRSFRLPDPATKVIMVGPGTGIAPFRAFLYERKATGATGENWLFFGDQRRDHDFLYADELMRFTEEGLLSHLDLAFSRDQEHKVYVQDRMRERGADLYAWLADGAHFYVCGDADQMAVDVEGALLDIVAEHGAMSRTQAEEFVAELKKTKRYLRDVY